MAVYTPISIYQGSIPTSGTTAVSASNKLILKEILLCNTSGNIVQIDIAKLLTSEVTAGVKNMLFNGAGMVLQAYETKQLTVSIVLEVGQALFLDCNADLVVGVNISGVEVV